MKAFFKGFVFAFNGIKLLIATERNARFHLFVAFLLIPMMIYFPLSQGEVTTTILCISLVLAAEAFNSALEQLANRITSEHDNLIGQAKDLAAAAVLILSIGSAIIGLIIYLPHIIQLFSS